jgi:glycosyltransferase involved in cell wall biosynthesis
MTPKICHINLAKGFRGGERQTFLLVNELAGKIQQTVIIRKRSKLSKMLNTLDRVDVIEIGKPFLMNLNKLKSFSLIHAHEAKAAHLAFFSSLAYKTPYIITRRVIKSPKNNYFFKKVHLRASKVVAISKQVKKVLKTIDKDIQSEVIFSSFSKLAVNTSEINRLLDKYKNKFLIGHVGAFVNKDKGQTHITNVAKKIFQKNPNIHFLFLGDGIDKDLFKKQAKGYDNIEFVGFKDNIGDYYSIFDLFLFPSLDEGLGSAVLDAFYFNLPVIATDVGGIPDMIKPNKTGILIQPKDENEMYDQIMALYQNPALCRELGKNARDSLPRFDIKNTTSQYMKLYQDLLNTNKNILP